MKEDKAAHLAVMHNGDVFRGRGTLGVVHHGVSLQAGDPAGRQHLVVLVHTQRLPSHVLHRQRLTAENTRFNTFTAQETIAGTISQSHLDPPQNHK